MHLNVLVPPVYGFIFADQGSSQSDPCLSDFDSQPVTRYRKDGATPIWSRF